MSGNMGCDSQEYWQKADSVAHSSGKQCDMDRRKCSTNGFGTNKAWCEAGMTYTNCSSGERGGMPSGCNKNMSRVTHCAKSRHSGA